MVQSEPIVVRVALGSDVEDTTDAEFFEFNHVRGEAKFGTEVEEAWEDRRDAECGEFF